LPALSHKLWVMIPGKESNAMKKFRTTETVFLAELVAGARKQRFLRLIEKTIPKLAA
jgi:hypothetical protein